jgi:hypothetical protein
MSSTKTIGLNALGIVLSLVGGAILLFGLYNVVAALAWGIGRSGDLFLVFLFVLYAIPAGLGSLILGMFLQQTANSEVYVQPAIGSQRQLGRFLLLPAVAVFVLMALDPDYRFWIFDARLGVVMALFAAALFILGSCLLWNALVRDHAHA